MILIGASGHAKVILDIMEKSGQSVDFLVDANDRIKQLNGIPVIHQDEYKAEQQHELILSIGENQLQPPFQPGLARPYILELFWLQM